MQRHIKDRSMPLTLERSGSGRPKKSWRGYSLAYLPILTQCRRKISESSKIGSGTENGIRIPAPPPPSAVNCPGTGDEPALSSTSVTEQDTLHLPLPGTTSSIALPFVNTPQTAELLRREISDPENSLNRGPGPCWRCITVHQRVRLPTPNLHSNHGVLRIKIIDVYLYMTNRSISVFLLHFGLVKNVNTLGSLVCERLQGSCLTI